MPAIAAVTPTGAEIDLPSEAVEDLAEKLRGELIQPGDGDYEPARRIWNGVIDRRPALIVRCRSAGDVATAVRFAGEQGLLVAVRGGGHGVAGHAVADGGLVIDLTEMRAVEVDAEGRSARAEGGCTLGDVDRETQRHGLAAPLGVASETGIAGLTLSGGMGWLRRRHGLSCDNLLSAEVVTADGSLLTASESENEDLFWAIRGGGGNFGVVTSFEYRLHPVGPEVFLCFVLYPADRTREVLRACDRYVADAPEEVAPIAVLGRVPEADEFPPEAHGDPFVALLAVHPGDAEEGERVLLPLRELGDPIGDVSGALPFTDAQRALDEDYPDGRHYYWKSVNVPELSDAVIDRLVEHAAVAPSPLSTVDVWYHGGAMARVGERETAFGNRSAPYLLGIEGNWDGDGGLDENVAWVRRAFDDMRELSDGGVYLNFPGFLEEGEDLVREGHGQNYTRLVEVKRRYDPTNLFRLNANIEPGA